MGHRLILKPESRLRKITTQSVLDEIVSEIAVNHHFGVDLESELMRALAVSLFLLLIGLLTGASMLVYAAYVLIAIYMLTRYLSRKWADSLVALLQSTAHEVEIGQNGFINFKLQNGGEAAKHLDLARRYSAAWGNGGATTGSQDRRQQLAIVFLSTGSAKLHSYKLTALRRGYFQIGPLNC